jgi:hypothetical protein
MTMKKSMHMIAAMAAFSAMGTQPDPNPCRESPKFTEPDFQAWARRKIEEDKAKQKQPTAKKPKKKRHVFAVDYRKGKKPVFK